MTLSTLLTITSTMALALLTFSFPITDLDARVKSRTAGFYHEEDHAEPTADIVVFGRCGGSPFTVHVTIVGWEGKEPRLFKGCAKDVEDDARWHLEPFLGPLTDAQVKVLVAEVEEAAKEAY